MSCSCKHTTEEEKQRKAYQKKKWKCDICDLVIALSSKYAHLRSNAHRDTQPKRSCLCRIML